MRAAAATALAKALAEAGPVVLEPVMALEVHAPEAYVGAVLSDLATHRRASRPASDDSSPTLCV